MSEILPFIIVGITVGSVYSLAGVGLVLTYKMSNIFNFAHGAFATATAYVFYVLHFEHNVPWPLAGIISIALLGIGLGAGFESISRRLSQVSPAWQVASTIGILLSVEAICSLIFGTESRSFPAFLPRTGFHLGGVAITYEQFIVVLTSFVATAALYLAFRLTRVGIAMRAAVESPDLLAVAGTNPRYVLRWAWAIGCSFAALSGLLLAPSVNLDPFTLTLLVVQAFGAAAIGNFSSLPLTWVGGLVIGIAGSVATKYAASHEILNGISPGLPFIVLFLVLLLSPRARLGIRRIDLAVRAREWRAPNRVQLVIGAVVVAVLIVIPFLVTYRTPSYTLMLGALLLFLSLGLLAKVAGQVSLCQVSFAAIGAVAFSKFAVGGHVPWLIALILAGLVAVPIGALLAIPAIRFSGLYLALATFGFGLLLQNMFYQSDVMFGLGGASLTLPMPHLSWLHLDTTYGFYYVVLVITAVAAVGVVVLTRSRFGRLLRGSADSPRAMAAMGNGVQIPLVLVFCASAFLAAIAGALQGMAYGSVSGIDYDPTQSLLYFAVVLVIVGTEPWYALVAAAGLLLIPVYVTSPAATYYLQLLFGLAAIVAALGGRPQLRGLDPLRRWLARQGRPSAAAALASGGLVASAPAGSGDGTEDGTPASHADARLDVRNLAVRFGGLLAVQEMNLTVTAGRVTGLIGPNGAGKTTVLNACSGDVRPGSGSIVLDGKDLADAGPAARARLGLGRSFQQMELCDSLSVWENVAMGPEAAMAGAKLTRQVIPERHDRAAIQESTVDALTKCGLAPIADDQVGTVSSTQRRMVEIARCVASPFRLLLLDEPSSGLDVGATAQLGSLLRQLAEVHNIGILLVEHDMSLVMSICDDIYVMESGKGIFHGDPQMVQQSEAVREAYLGAIGTSTGTEVEPQW